MRDESDEVVNPFTAPIQPKATGIHHVTAQAPPDRRRRWGTGFSIGGLICAMPIYITVGAIGLAEARGSWDRASADTSSGFDALLVLASVLSFAVFIVFPIPAIALSLIGLLMNRSKFALIAFVAALLPIACIAAYIAYDLGGLISVSMLPMGGFW